MTAASRSSCLFATVAAFATVSCNTADRSDGERSFDRNCGTCHTADELPESRLSGLADPRKRTALDQFLARHHAPDPAVRAEIVEYLATQER